MDVKEWNPGTLMQVSGGFWRTAAIHTGVKLGLFTALGEKRVSAEKLAQTLNTDPDGTGRLLNALAAMNLLVKSGGRYHNTPFGLKYLSQGSPDYMGYMIMHHHHLVESWSRLDESVKTGQPVRKRQAFHDEAQRESFLMGMFNMGMNTAPQVAETLPLSDRRHLLDLGGGPGTYAIHFCMKNPGLTATVYDLPTTRSFAEQTIEKFNLSDRIRFVAGNYLEEESLRGEYDAIWLSHVMHGEGPADCRNVLRKAVAVARPGARVWVQDFILNPEKDGPLFPALFSLNMLLGTPNGRAYSQKELMGFLEDAGLKSVERVDFQGPNDSGIMTGLVPA